MRIGTREVGPGQPAFIVAEVGSNHGGDLARALALVDAAAAAGADAVKFQAWHADHMYPPETEEHAAARKWQLPLDWLPELSERAHKLTLAFGCSAFCFDALDEVDKYVDFHKVASIEAMWGAFVYRVERKNKPTFVSVGMQDIDAGEIPNYESRDVILHCTVAYPAALEDVHLRSRKFNSTTRLWGLSDHTTDPIIAPCAAVALGACVIEKHMRPDEHSDRVLYRTENMPPDWGHSIPAWKFRVMVDSVRLTEKVLGSSEKRIRPSEEKYLKYRRGPRGLRGA